jgi:glycosyltransferase involved in cell wall biosynthesis
MGKRTLGVSENIQTRRGLFRLSVVVPMFNEEASITALFPPVVAIAEQVTPDYEIVAVNDGSTDNTLLMLAAAHLDNPRIKVVNLSRNFGKEMALTAGLDHASGDAVVLLDADLQHPPEVIPEMVAKWREGYDMVVMIRSSREEETIAKRTFARSFYWIMQHLSRVPIQPDAGDFRLLDRKIVDALKLLPENNRFMKGLFAWVGFRQASIPFRVPPRQRGKSKWGLFRLWNFALDGIFSATTLPLRIWTYLGSGIALFALSYMMFIVIRTLIYGSDVPGYASLAAILLFFSGMNMIGLGILGEYLGRVFIEVKQRPRYLVQELIGFESEPRGKTKVRAADAKAISTKS